MSTSSQNSRYIVELIGWEPVGEGLYESSSSLRYEVAAPSAEQALAKIRALKSRTERAEDIENFDIHVIRISPVVPAN